eukprot:6205730-Pleurochrysis_carterae.AAC.1
MQHPMKRLHTARPGAGVNCLSCRRCAQTQRGDARQKFRRRAARRRSLDHGGHEHVGPAPDPLSS